MIGQNISHYKIVAQIGAGGMGIVYEAEDLTLKRHVAIKTLKDLNSHGPRLLREAQAISDISHPGIASVYEYGETDEGLPYIVMELVKGRPLDEFIRNNRLSLFQIIEIIIQVARALSAAHERGIIHRDIKPSNILINDSHSVKVLDFGLSKQLRNGDGVSSAECDPDATQTMEGVILGTPLYLSPEQAAGKKADERSDIFSLGALLYECITGRSPFYAASIMEICTRILRDDPPPPSTLTPAIPDLLDKITLKALAKKPEERYQNMGDMIQDLDSLQTDIFKDEIFLPQVSQGLSHSISQRLRTSFGDVLRYRYLKAIVFVAMVMVGVGAFLFWQSRQTYQANPEAQRSYDKGVAAFNDGAFFVARNNFEKAVAADGDFAMAHARYAETLYELGYLERARAQREKANSVGLFNLKSLSAPDKFRLQGINNTLLSDFEMAVKNYREMLDHVPQAEKQQALLDLGRAYERVQDHDAAIKAYKEALTYDPDLPSANVRLAVLYGRRLENHLSAGYFANAERLYQVQNNSEGDIEVSYQRGFLISITDDASKAQAEVEKSLKKAEINDIPYQQIRCLLLISRILRSYGDRKKAVSYAENALALSRNNGVDNLHAQSVLELGTDYLFLGNYDEADNKYNEALQLADQYELRYTKNRVLLQFAALYVRQHRADDALERVNEVRGFFERGGYKKDMLDLLSIEAQAITLNGDLKSALSIYEDLLTRAINADDQIIKARAKKGIGTTLAAMDESTRAFLPMYESYSINNSIHKTFEAGFALVQYADILVHLGLYSMADVGLNQAEGLAQKNESLIPRIDLVKAKKALSKQNYPEVIRIGRKMFREDPNAGDQKKELPSTTEARTLLAVAMVRSGEKLKAKQLIESIDLDVSNFREKELLAKMYSARAEIMLENGRNDMALEAATNAQTIFKELEKPSFEWQAWILLGKAQTRLNDSEGANASLANAGAIFSTLAQRWGQDFKSYSDRPDVKYYRDVLGHF